MAIFKCPITATVPEDFKDESCFGLCTKLHNAYTQVHPHIEPHYTKYAAPYVEKASPYFSKAQTVYLDTVEPNLLKIAARGKSIAEPYTAKVVEQKHKADTILQPYYSKACEFHEHNVHPLVSKSTAVASKAYQDYGIPIGSRIAVYLDHTQRYVVTRIVPKIKTYAESAYINTLVLINEIAIWIEVKVAPEISHIYQKNIEPHVSNIYHQIIENNTKVPASEDIAKSISKDTILPLSTESLKVTPSATSTSSASSSSTAQSTETKQPAASQEAEVTNPSEVKLSTGAQISAEIASWKSVVQETTKEALDTFLDDVEKKKSEVIEEVKPKFTDLLRKLSDLQSQSVKALTELVDSIPTGEEEEEVEKDKGKDFSLRPEDVQKEFRRRADEIRVAALNVRHYAEEVANRILDNTEKIRGDTLDVLDEFADVALGELGRNLVSIDHKQASSSNVPNWKDWKEFRALKDQLYDARQEILDLDINMETVNQMLRDAQETANILTQEAAQYFGGIRAKADFTFQQAIVYKNKRATEKGEELPDEQPENAIFYDASDEEEVKSSVSSSAASEPSVSILPVLGADEEVVVDHGGDAPVSILPVIGADEKIDVDIDGGDAPVSILPVVGAGEEIDIDLNGEAPVSILPVIGADETVKVDHGDEGTVSNLPVSTQQVDEAEDDNDDNEVITETRRIKVTRAVYVTQAEESKPFETLSVIEHTEL